MSSKELRCKSINRNKPSLIIADEPTGNLDSKTAISVVSLFNELVDEYDCSLILATHNLGIANLQDRLINIEDSDKITK